MFRTSRPLTGAVAAFEWTLSSQSHVKLNISGSIIHLPHPNTPAVSCHTITRAHADSKRVNWKLFPASASCSLTYFSPPPFLFFFQKGHVTSLCDEMSHRSRCRRRRRRRVRLSNALKSRRGNDPFVFFLLLPSSLKNQTCTKNNSAGRRESLWIITRASGF